MRATHHPVKDPLRRIQIEAARRCGVSVADILGKRRSRRIALARKACYLAARRLSCQPSYPELGEAFDRDHTTVMSGVRSAQRLEVSSAWFGRLMSELAQVEDAERPALTPLVEAS